jgi:hypothetical protein
VYEAASLLRDREPDENDLRTARRTLQLLWKEGLLNRLPYVEPGREHGSVSHVYGLSDKGIESYGHDDARFIKTFDEHSARTLDHELEISYFHLALKRFCQKHALDFHWQQADLKTATIHPDAYFSIGKEDTWHHFFLEIERSKISNYKDGEPSIIRKLGKYYDLFDTRTCDKDWGFRQFRVIVVQRTDERRRNLCYALQEKYRHRMFWLTTEARYKEDIGAEAFLTPKDHQEKAYGFLTIRENLVNLTQSLEKAGTLILSPASEQPLGSS